MTRYIYRKIAALLDKRCFRDNDELYLLITLLVAVWFTSLVHIIQAVLFWRSNMTPMLRVTSASLVLNAVSAVLVHTRLYAAGGILLTAEVTAYSLIITRILGTGSFGVLFLPLALMLQFLVPYACKKARIFVGGMLYAALCAVVYIGVNFPPLYGLGRIRLPLGLLNISVGFLGVAAFFGVAGATKSIVMQYGEERVERYRTQANTDPLTGLLNRRYAGEFFRDLEKSRDENWCVGMMDIDDFKLINDLHGHNAGDSVLILVADTMRETLRKTDVLIRWGGEEFMLLLADVDTGTAVTILDKLREAISGAFITADGKDISVTVTIGVARLASKDVQGSICISDEMLYEGKKRGKNRVVSI